MRILAVDDDELIRDLLAEIFRATNFKDVVIVDSTDAAVQAIRNSYKPFDCFLIDIQMPGRNGVELCQALRRVEVFANTPILMLTAMSRKEHVDQSFFAGATDYVTKPFDPQELVSRLHAIEMLLEGTRRAAEARDRAEAAGRPVAKTRDYADAINIGTVPGLVDAGVLRNYATLLAANKRVRNCAFGVRIPELQRKFMLMSEKGFGDYIADLSRVILNTLSASEPFMTYVGSGTFVCVCEKGQIPPKDALGKVIAAQINDPEVFRRATPNIWLHPVVGDAVAPGLFAGDQVTDFISRALGAVEHVVPDGDGPAPPRVRPVRLVRNLEAAQ